MGKVKNMAWDNAETEVDTILSKMNTKNKDGEYNTTVAKNKILAVNNVALTGIDENNVDEIIAEKYII